MYCPTCRTQVAAALSYCTRCGANLSPVKGHGETRPAGELNSLIWAIVATTIIVLGMGLGALVLMKDGSIPEGLGTAFVILCFLTLPVIEGLLVWQLLLVNRRGKQASGVAQRNEQQTEELGAPPPRSLSEPVEPVPSVTEQTTRALEPLYREGKG
jgi:hypothetical protein